MFILKRDDLSPALARMAALGKNQQEQNQSARAKANSFQPTLQEETIYQMATANTSPNTPRSHNRARLATTTPRFANSPAPRGGQGQGSPKASRSTEPFPLPAGEGKG